MTFWFRSNATRVDIDPLRYLIVPPETAVVQQTNNAYHIQWRPQADHVRIFVQSLSDQADQKRFVQQVPGGVQEATIRLGETAVHPIFSLQFKGGLPDGRFVQVAERFMPLQGTVNFRDVGGYETENGRFVRWGQLYRGGILTHLTPADQTYLHQLDIRTICDVRTAEEVGRRPDRLDALPHVQRVLLPMETVDRLAKLRAFGIVLFQRDRLFDVLRRGYTHVILEQNAHVVREIFMLMADPANLPGVIHCTAGKDRTGVIVALLLSILGVPRKTIVADYTLSNYFYDFFRESLQLNVQPLTRLGVTIDDLWPFLVVDGATLEYTLATLDRRYGSVQQYLVERVGVETAVLDRLRNNFLE